MSDPSVLLAALVLAHRSGDLSAVHAALTRLAALGVRISFGDTLPPRKRTPPVRHPAT